jgi:hypothetical protein
MANHCFQRWLALSGVELTKTYWALTDDCRVVSSGTQGMAGPRAGAVIADIQVGSEFRWTAEELRVSLFAQPLGTSVKASPQRCEKLLVWIWARGSFPQHLQRRVARYG